MKSKKICRQKPFHREGINNFLIGGYTPQILGRVKPAEKATAKRILVCNARQVLMVAKRFDNTNFGHYLAM